MYQEGGLLKLNGEGRRDPHIPGIGNRNLEPRLTCTALLVCGRS